MLLITPNKYKKPSMAAYVLGDLAVRIRKTLAIPQGQCGV